MKIQLTVEQALELLQRSQRWLAGQVGIDPSLLNRMIHGERPWTPEAKRDIELALGLAEGVLVFDGERENAISPGGSRSLEGT